MGADPLTIITGGGRGIGRTIALRMVRETAIMLVGRTSEDLCSTTEKSLAGRMDAWAGYTTGDVSDPATAIKCRELCSGFDVRNLICNAGIRKGGPTETFSAENWKRMFDVNVHGAFYFIRTFLPEMIKNGGGNIILMSSTAGLRGLKRNMAYSATKAALISMVKSLAAEHAKHGIRCVAICPNVIEGGMTDSMIKNLARHRGISEGDARQIVINSTPEKRIILQEEVAEAIATICNGGPIPKDNVLVINGEKP